MMSQEEIEALVKLTFTDMSFVYRDVTLSGDLISRYKVGQIIMERGFTDASYKAGQPTESLRYLIATNQGKDLSEFNPESARRGHIMIGSGAYFKVVDIYRVKNKTQVVLLNIPESGIDFFAMATSNIEDQLTSDSRVDFDDNLLRTATSELQDKEWKERTANPLGMSEQGRFFYETPQVEGNPAVEESALGTRNTDVKPRKPWWKRRKT